MEDGLEAFGDAVKRRLEVKRAHAARSPVSIDEPRQDRHFTSISGTEVCGLSSFDPPWQLRISLAEPREGGTWLRTSLLFENMGLVIRPNLHRNSDVDGEEVRT